MKKGICILVISLFCTTVFATEIDDLYKDILEKMYNAFLNRCIQNESLRDGYIAHVIKFVLENYDNEEKLKALSESLKALSE